MKKQIGFMIVIGILFLFSPGVYAETAKAQLRNAKGEEIGTATFTEMKEGVKISLSVHGLTPGLHGFHIHTVGKCEPPDFASAGGHFNPHGKKHGLKNPEGAHAGDLQNLVVDTDGTAKGEWVTKEVTLGPGTTSLLDTDGSSLVIHANPDDEMTDPAGSAGARIACGVITE